MQHAVHVALRHPREEATHALQAGRLVDQLQRLYRDNDARMRPGLHLPGRAAHSGLQLAAFPAAVILHQEDRRLRLRLWGCVKAEEAAGTQQGAGSLFKGRCSGCILTGWCCNLCDTRQ